LGVHCGHWDRHADERRRNYNVVHAYFHGPSRRLPFPVVSIADASLRMLDSGSGQKLSLGGDGVKQQLTKQICDKILDQGKSML
jgi:hypothetical protein